MNSKHPRDLDEEFIALYQQLGRYDRFTVLVRLYWLVGRAWIRRIPKRWVTWQMRARP